MRLMRLNESNSPLIWSGHQTVFFVEWAGMVFFIQLIEQDVIDWVQYFFIPFHSFEPDRMSQKLNLAHAWDHFLSYEENDVLWIQTLFLIPWPFFRLRASKTRRPARDSTSGRRGKLWQPWQPRTSTKRLSSVVKVMKLFLFNSTNELLSLGLLHWWSRERKSW